MLFLPYLEKLYIFCYEVSYEIMHLAHAFKSSPYGTNPSTNTDHVAIRIYEQCVQAVRPLKWILK